MRKGDKSGAEPCYLLYQREMRIQTHPPRVDHEATFRSADGEGVVQTKSRLRGVDKQPKRREAINKAFVGHCFSPAESS